MTEMIKMELEVPKEAGELGVMLKNLMLRTDEALKDGWQPGSDLPEILLGSFADYASGLGGLQHIGKEGKAHPGKTANAIIAPMLEGVEALLKDE